MDLGFMSTHLFILKTPQLMGKCFIGVLDTFYDAMIMI